MKSPIYVVLAFASVLPAQAEVVEKLEREAAIKRMEAAVLEAKLEVARLEKELEDAKKGKSKRKSKAVDIKPRWEAPNIRPGEVTVARGAKGSWWYYERRAGSGLLSLHEYSSKDEAMKWATHFASTESSLVFVSLADLDKRGKR